MLTRCFFAGGLLAISVAAAAAQTSGGCSYATCALGIAPRINALDVVRGDAQTRVGSLSFVWPRATLVRTFDGDARAERLAARSVRTRRVGAALTDAGAMLVVAAVIRSAMVRGDRRWSAGMAGLGAASIAASTPVQFAADAQLSRAVFEFNRRYAR
jgi:hypothetical protein